MLERLVPKNRRVATGMGAGAGVGADADVVIEGQELGVKGRRVGAGGNGKKGPGEKEEGPRRFRLKIGTVGAKMLSGADSNHKPTLASKADSKGGGNG